MINSISIKNYQGHKNTNISFSPGVNAIVGKSDSGKSSIIRALLWVLTNRPLGDSVRSHWADKNDTSVEISTKENDTVVRTKNKTKNAYWLNDQEFKALGTDVPQQILDVLNMSEINIQKQMDSPFLISMSPGDVARLLNKITNLDLIDIAFQNINRKVSDNRSWEKNLLNEKQILIEKQKQYEGLDDIAKSYENLSEMFYNHETKKTHLQNLAVLCNTIHNLQAEKKDLSAVSKKLQEIEKQIMLWSTKKALLKKLQVHITEIEYHKKQCKNIDGIKTKLNTIDPLLQRLRDLQEKKNALQTLKQLIESIEKGRTSILHSHKIITNTETEYNTMMPNECPLCGSKKGKRG